MRPGRGGLPGWAGAEHTGACHLRGPAGRATPHSEQLSPGGCGKGGRARVREGVPWSESLVLAPLKIYLFVLLEAASRKNEDTARSSLVGFPPL